MPCGSRRTLAANGLALALYEWGEGPGTPLLLLHSLAAHSHWWDWTAPLLAAGRRAVALDFRGHGASAHAVPPAYSFDDHAADVVGALDVLGIPRALVVGHSMGAFVGALVAARHAERVRALVIADMLTGWTPEQAAMAERQAARPPQAFPAATEAAARFRLQPPETRAAPEVLAHVAETAVSATPEGAWRLAFDRAVFLHPPVDPWEALGAVGCPTLVIHGEGSAVMDRAAAGRVATAVRRGTALTLAGTYHHLVLDAPGAFAAAVGGWLDSTAGG